MSTFYQESLPLSLLHSHVYIIDLLLLSVSAGEQSLLSSLWYQVEDMARKATLGALAVYLWQASIEPNRI